MQNVLASKKHVPFSEPEKCMCRKCLLAFKDPSLLLQHMLDNHRTSQGILPGYKTPSYLCDLCQETHANMRYHFKRYHLHGYKFYACCYDNCRKRFYDASQLKYHIQTVHDKVLGADEENAYLVDFGFDEQEEFQEQEDSSPAESSDYSMVPGSPVLPEIAPVQENLQIILKKPEDVLYDRFRNLIQEDDADNIEKLLTQKNPSSAMNKILDDNYPAIMLKMCLEDKKINILDRVISEKFYCTENIFWKKIEQEDVLELAQMADRLDQKKFSEKLLTIYEMRESIINRMQNLFVSEKACLEKYINNDNAEKINNLLSSQNPSPYMKKRLEKKGFASGLLKLVLMENKRNIAKLLLSLKFYNTNSHFWGKVSQEDLIKVQIIAENKKLHDIVEKIVAIRSRRENFTQQLNDAITKGEEAKVNALLSNPIYLRYISQKDLFEISKKELFNKKTDVFDKVQTIYNDRYNAIEQLKEALVNKNYTLAKQMLASDGYMINMSQDDLFDISKTVTDQPSVSEMVDTIYNERA